MLLVSAYALAQPARYHYFCAENQQDKTTKTEFGVALLGGGSDIDEAFRWMCAKSGGGDFLVVRATGGDDYNPYIAKLCHENSVATLIIPNREAALDPAVAAIIGRAEALFIAGGDQSNYVKYWKGTPVEEAINGLIRRGVPVGGTSAGLAVLGEFSFSAMNGSAYSKDTLANPFNDRVTIARDFLRVPQLENTITDTHFVKRDRQGRFLGFMARILADGMSKEVRGIAVDEKSAALMEADGSVRIIGSGRGAYFYRPQKAPEVCAPGKPLTFRDLQVYRTPTGGTFDLTRWIGSKGNSYVLNVVNGVVTTTLSGGSVY
jgi:cyanophycinase